MDVFLPLSAGGWESWERPNFTIVTSSSPLLGATCVYLSSDPVSRVSLQVTLVRGDRAVAQAMGSQVRQRGVLHEGCGLGSAVVC